MKRTGGKESHSKVREETSPSEKTARADGKMQSTPARDDIAVSNSLAVQAS
jgi:hypothetical protein